MVNDRHVILRSPLLLVSAVHLLRSTNSGVKLKFVALHQKMLSLNILTKLKMTRTDSLSRFNNWEFAAHLTHFPSLPSSLFLHCASKPYLLD